MFYFALFFIELIALFLLSRTLTRDLSYFFYRFSRSQHVTITAIAILFFPGTLLHELAHALMAGLLGVPVGEIEFMPKIQGEHVKLGSVQIGHTDPIRRFFIGTAPFIIGTLILLGILFYTVQNHFFGNYFLIAFVGYLVFEIGNTMFSSRKDMEGALELFGTIIILLIVFYLLGIRLPSFNPNSILGKPLVQEVFRQGSLFILVPLAIDTVVIFLFHPRRRR
jgi:hypothetical protein